MPTIGVDFKIRTHEVDQKAVKLQIWDTAGHERFKTITSSYYKGAHGVIVTYDVTQRDSFSAVQNWMAEVEKHSGDNISRILVGNKSDLESSRAVSIEEGQEMADHYNVRFLETSAKASNNVEQAFTLMTREIKSRVTFMKPKPRNTVLSNEATTKLGKSNTVPVKTSCC